MRILASLTIPFILVFPLIVEIYLLVEVYYIIDPVITLLSISYYEIIVLVEPVFITPSIIGDELNLIGIEYNL